jgi:hypothetical protein
VKSELEMPVSAKGRWASGEWLCHKWGLNKVWVCQTLRSFTWHIQVGNTRHNLWRKNCGEWCDLFIDNYRKASFCQRQESVSNRSLELAAKPGNQRKISRKDTNGAKGQSHNVFSSWHASYRLQSKNKRCE